MKKSILWIVVLTVCVALALTFGLSGCKTTTATETTAAETTAAATTAAATTAAAETTAAATTEKKLTIGISIQNMANEMVTIITEAQLAQAKKLGIDTVSNDAKGVPETQLSQVETMVAQKVDAIILNPVDKSALVPAVKICADAGIPLIIVNTVLDNQDEALTYVGSDDVDAGKIEMQYVADVLEGKGNIAIMHGPMGHPAEVLRNIGIYQILEKYPDIKILSEQTANWDRAQGMALMENWLSAGFDLDCVLGHNDEMALGAYVAIEAAGKQNDIKVIGIDAIPDALKAVQDGHFIGTVFQDGAGQGTKSVDIAIMAAKGETVEKAYMIPFILVTKDNLAEYMK